jgi:hypothetical protein
MLATPALLLAAAAAWPVRAEAVTEAEYTIDAPAGWQRADGTASGAVATRKVVVFHAPDDLETNVNVITTNASVELTKLSSLGNAFEFGHRMTVSQDRRGRKPGKGAQIAELLNTEERDGAYLVEYTIQRPDDAVDRHLYSLVAMRFDGTYNKLYTVTGQYRAADKDKFDALVKQCVASFKLA